MRVQTTEAQTGNIASYMLDWNYMGLVSMCLNEIRCQGNVLALPRTVTWVRHQISESTTM